MRKRPRWMDLLWFAFAVSVGAALSLGPWRAYQREARQNAETREKLRLAESRHTEYAEQRARLESPVGREELAREKGYRRPDEIPISR